MSTKQEFWDNVSKYREMGMDPLRWVAGCAVKVDLNSVVYPTLHNLKPNLKKMGISLGARVDADIFPLVGDGPVVTRRIYDPFSTNIDTDDLKKLILNVRFHFCRYFKKTLKNKKNSKSC